MFYPQEVLILSILWDYLSVLFIEWCSFFYQFFVIHFPSLYFAKQISQLTAPSQTDTSHTSVFLCVHFLYYASYWSISFSSSCLWRWWVPLHQWLPEFTCESLFCIYSTSTHAQSRRYISTYIQTHLYSQTHIAHIGQPHHSVLLKEIHVHYLIRF